MDFQKRHPILSFFLTIVFVLGMLVVMPMFVNPAISNYQTTSAYQNCIAQPDCRTNVIESIAISTNGAWTTSALPANPSAKQCDGMVISTIADMIVTATCGDEKVTLNIKKIYPAIEKTWVTKITR